MRTPELTYVLAQAKDITGGMLQIVQRAEQQSFLNVLIGVTAYGVPLDRILVLSTAAVVIIPGGGQTVIRGNLTVRDLNNANPDADIEIANYPPESGAGTADRRVHFNFSGEVWVPPGASVQANALLDSGVNANDIELSITGISIPRANVQQG